MSPADEDYHEMELSRRSIQISDLQEELDGGRERVQEAEDRNAALERQIEKKKVEISIRKSKAQEMDDQVASDEATCQQNQRLLNEEIEASRMELSRLEAEVAAAEAARVQAEALAEARRAAEAEDEEDQKRAEEEASQALRMAAIETAVAAAEADVESVQAVIRDLEATLDLEKKTNEDLQDSLSEAEETRNAAKAECERLSKVLEAMSSKGELHRLREAVFKARADQQQCTQEIARKKQETAMEVQSIQGRLEETKRMMHGQTSEIERTLADTRESITNSPLVESLQEARSQSEASRNKRLALEAEVQRVEKELVDLQGTLDQEQSRVEEQHCESLKKELQGVREDLEAARRRLGQSEEAAKQSQSGLLLAQHKSKQNLEVLRLKLEELWHGIRSLPVNP